MFCCFELVLGAGGYLSLLDFWGERDFYQGIVIAGFCFVSWTSILEKYSPSKLVVLFFLTPLFGVFLSYLLLGDEIGFGLIVGACLVAYGIYLVNKK